MEQRFTSSRIISICLAFGVIGVAQAQTTTRISVAGLNGQSDGDCPQASMSANGRFVVFTSKAPSLLNITTGTLTAATYMQVFKRDTVTNTTTIVSLDPSGALANGDCTNPRISPDGTYVTFTSYAFNLVAGDGNGQRDVFIRNTNNGTNSIVSLTNGGLPSNGTSDSGSMSGDGNLVVFRSEATNLVSGASGSQVYIRNISSGTTELVSKGDTIFGAPGNDYSGVQPSITPDGRYVGFSSKASNLVAGDTNGYYDVFVRDMALQTNRRISLTIGGNQGFGDSHSCAISDNGQFVAFASRIPFVTGDSNGLADVFLRDFGANTLTRVSVDASAKQSNGVSGGTNNDVIGWGICISGNGQKIAYQSTATNLVKGDTNGFEDVFVKDRITGSSSMISVNTLGKPANGASGLPTISTDGQFISFVSGASNLVLGDTNSVLDVFRRG